MVGQKYFRRGKRMFGGIKYTKYNKINKNSENFRGARFLLRNPLSPFNCGPAFKNF